MSFGATPPPAGSGLKATLKVAVPLVALVGVVFGVTYLAQYTPPKDDPDKEKKVGPDGGFASGEPPLRFFTSARRWDPPLLAVPGYRNHPLLAPSAIGPPPDPESGRVFTFTLQDRIFQGFYEPGETLRATQFWFENRNPNAVQMQLKGVSCTACTGGRLAPIPPEMTKNLLQHAALASLPLGAFNGYGIGLVQPAANLTQLQWTEYQFKDNQNATYKVPAATNPDKWAPQWGILELTFKVSKDPKMPLTASFATQVEGSSQFGENNFVLGFEVAPQCELSRPSIDVGKLDPLSGDRTYEFLVYSATRGPGSEFGDLAVPSSLVQAPAGITDAAQFVEVTKVTRVPEAELSDVGEALAQGSKRLTNVRAAYRVTVVVRPKVGDHRLDIGLMERTISLTVGTVTQQLLVRATVRGAVWLDDDASEVIVTGLQGPRGGKQVIDLSTEKAGVELAIVKDECKSDPKNLVYELVKQPDRGGQGHYKLNIVFAPGQAFGQVKGVVVLEVKGPNPQRIRIPFKGNASL